ncbi:ABC transporter ATP-binding protein [Marinimicrobium sp. ABcell2]|uniref:ABC transporter ATP-binding protein n=1 Tax=Marinimicrobium sp. ABcell2 TaxID=3069751 RepID=UPI0027B360FA|nr:ABC transporter ATP-binding protein [Marinimicrobium sp. ABcell2]MDQ2076827.1 ABC transporter ATP-binding protein [Marinimicrobium sp. ABcell2]
MDSVIHARDLRKVYGKTPALDGVDLDVAPGQIVGLIGPNGAGKTTLLKGILGLATVEGDLSVLGMNPRHERSRLLERVSFIADTAILPRWLKVHEAVSYMEQVHPRFDRAKAEVFLKRTDIKRDSRVRELSKGMMTQLHLALIMAIDSKLLVLDEPTLGLDILYRKQFYRALLDDYFDEQKTILVTTHQVEEIENLLTHVVFIKNGKLCLQAEMDDIEHRYTELQVSQEQVAAAQALQPIHSRPILGGRAMIFEDVARAQLEPLGETRTPTLADLFVAKMEMPRDAAAGGEHE